MSKLTRLFVYGSLAPGEKNHHQMDGMTGVWEPATIRGQLGICEWGEYKGYPAIIPDPYGDEIKGQLFTSPDLPDHWKRLDIFEGEFYKRVDILVALPDKTQILSQIYRILPPSRN